MTDVAIKATKDVDRAHPELSGKEREDAIQAQVNKSEWGVGGDKRRIVESGTALIQGLVNGDVNKAVANASAPYIANQIAQHIPAENKEGRIAAHGIANVALALSKGENAGAQSLGAMTAEAVGMLSQELYKKKPSELTEDEKSTVSAFASLAAGIAGGLVGGDTSSAANAAEAGKTTVENNQLSGKDVLNMQNELEVAEKEGKDTQPIHEKYGALSEKQREEAIVKECSNNVYCSLAAWEMMNTGSEQANSKLVAIFSKLSPEEQAKFNAFVNAENAESAHAIYQSLPTSVRVALQGKEILDSAGIRGAATGSGGISAIGIRGKGNKEKANETKDSDQPVKALDVASYKELKDRSKVGDGLEHDHIPSFAALKKAKEAELGRPLTKEESNKLFNGATAVEVPKDVHAAGPTYKGKNSAAQVQKDASNLCGAECRDTEALRKNMIDKGYDPKLVDDAIKKIIERNRDKGVIK